MQIVALHHIISISGLMKLVQTNKRDSTLFAQYN